MNHKISQFCDKIDSIKKMSDRLRDMKYGPVKASKLEIDNLIETIQADCFVVSKDKSKYDKKGSEGMAEYQNYDYSGVNHRDYESDL